MNELASEDRSRADHYAILSRLFFAAPDARLLAALAAAAAAAPAGALTEAWQALAEAAATTTTAAAQEEYAALFVGVGKPKVVLYASWHLTGFMMEKPLARLRADLAALGLARSGNVLEPEDHFAALMDAMRHLILATEPTESERLALQHGFFTEHILPWYERLCDAIEAQPEAGFYRAVSGFARAFLEMEKILL